MKKTLCKKIFWITLVAVGMFTINVSNVNAEVIQPVGRIGNTVLTEAQIREFDPAKYQACYETIKALNRETDDSTVLADRYAIEATLTDNNNYVIKIPRENLGRDLLPIASKIEFKLVRDRKSTRLNSSHAR